MMTERHTLTEHQSRELPLTPWQAQALVDACAGRIDVSPAEAPGTFRVKAHQHVGTVAVPGLELAIRPKVPLANLFTMLDVAEARIAWQDDDVGYGREIQLLPALAMLLAKATELALGRGLLRAYRAEEDLLLTLRGRVDLARQLRRPAQAFPVACRFEEFTVDVLENRALRAALRRCLVLGGVPERTRSLLRGQLARLADVQDLPVRAEDIDRITINRLNRHYERALKLAAIVLRHTTLVDAAGPDRASAFLVDMNKVFEDFVTERLARALRGRLRVITQRRHFLDLERQVTIIPDLELESDGRLVFVADVKYKLSDDALGRNADYYQLTAYTTSLGLPAGMLIYGHAGGGTPPRRARVQRAAVDLWSKAIRVAGSRQDLERSLVELADDVARLALPDPATIAAGALRSLSRHSSP